MVREKYPSNRGKERPAPLTEQNLREIFANAKQDESLKKILNPHLSKSGIFLISIIFIFI